MRKLFLYFTILFLATSCIKSINLYEGSEKEESPEVDIEVNNNLIYEYPFHSETINPIAEIIITTNQPIEDITNYKVEIPALKYNKSWLLLLTQDDCKQSAFCRTWAHINGKSVSNSEAYFFSDNEIYLYYDFLHLLKDDLPPNILSPRKTLGSTDGTGNEVRFTFTTTLAPEEKWMDKQTTVNPGFNDNYYRFFMQSGLNWSNVREMLNYDNGIAFHDLMADDINNHNDLIKHYDIAQDIILDKLNGRGCKMLTEPNGNKAYIEAAYNNADIQTITSQGNYSEDLYPFKINGNIEKSVWTRSFDNSPNYFKTMILENNLLPKEERKAICVGVHNTDNDWCNFITWVNDEYGKDGDDSVWFTSQEEYYEYTHYRLNGEKPIIEQIDDYSFRVIVKFPSNTYFYYPSTTINVNGVNIDDIKTINGNNTTIGLSYNNFKDGLMINIDCRRYLVERAEHYIMVYEQDKSNTSKKNDAIYFTNILKDSNLKTTLLQRIK